MDEDQEKKLQSILNAKKKPAAKAPTPKDPAAEIKRLLDERLAALITEFDGESDGKKKEAIRDQIEQVNGMRIAQPAGTPKPVPTEL